MKSMRKTQSSLSSASSPNFRTETGGIKKVAYSTIKRGTKVNTFDVMKSPKTYCTQLSKQYSPHASSKSVMKVVKGTRDPHNGKPGKTKEKVNNFGQDRLTKRKII